MIDECRSCLRRGLGQLVPLAEGVDLKTAQARLGHSNPRLTLGLYAQATEAADPSAAGRLGSWFLGVDDQADDDKRGMDAGWAACLS